MLEPLTLQPIAVVHSPYDEKFSVPRQPNLVAQGKGFIRLLPPYNFIKFLNEAGMQPCAHPA